jgi:hypothetical protein
MKNSSVQQSKCTTNKSIILSICLCALIELFKDKFFVCTYSVHKILKNFSHIEKGEKRSFTIFKHEKYHIIAFFKSTIKINVFSVFLLDLFLLKTCQMIFDILEDDQ